jgi:SAM-dependent methyltransferase
VTETPTYREGVRRSFNTRSAAQYRELDQQSLAPGRSGAHYCRILGQITASFNRPIAALDVGCGTGRYFHCLKRIDRLVGVDLSTAMLAHAEEPVRREQIDARSIELKNGDVLEIDLPHGGFDLIYSIGVLAEYSPLDARTLGRLRELLAPGGALFVTAVDSSSRVSVPERGEASFGRRLIRKAFPWLPRGVRRLLNRGLSPFYLSRPQLQAAFAAAGFEQVTLSAYLHTSGWQGVHWDCLARVEKI